MNVVELPKANRNQPLIDALNDALEQAQSGDVRGILIVKFRADGCFTVNRLGTMSDLELCGSLSFAQHDVMMANSPK